MKINISPNSPKTLLLSNKEGLEISFAISDYHVFRAISKYIEERAPEGSEVRTVMFSQDKKYLVFNDGYTIKLTDAAHFEISNRMILLNKDIIFPKVNDLPSLEEENEIEYL